MLLMIVWGAFTDERLPRPAHELPYCSLDWLERITRFEHVAHPMVDQPP